MPGNTNFYDSNSVFELSSAEFGGAIACFSCFLDFDGTTFINNGADNGGALYYAM